MSSATNTAVPFNIDGPDRVCDGCPARASFFLAYHRHGVTGLPVISQRWCHTCVPADWLPGRKIAEAA